MADRKPNKGLKACAIGCGVLVMLGVVLAVIGVGYFRKSAEAVMAAANGFVQEAMAGNEAEARGMMHPLQQEKTSPELFSEHWDAARNVIGASPQAETTSDPAANFETGFVTFQYRLTGGSGTVMVEVDVNPGEKPPTVINYRITGVPVAQPGNAETDTNE